MFRRTDRQSDSKQATFVRFRLSSETFQVDAGLFEDCHTGIHVFSLSRVLGAPTRAAWCILLGLLPDSPFQGGCRVIR